MCVNWNVLVYSLLYNGYLWVEVRYKLRLIGVYMKLEKDKSLMWFFFGG